MKDVEHKLHNEGRAVRALLDGLRLDPNDSELVRDTVEGESGLFEAIDAVLLSMDESAILIDGIKAREAELKERRSRLEKGVARKRALIEQAMLIAEQTELRRPMATLSLATRPGGVVITDESAIPAAYWVPSDPKLDKTALLAAMKGGQSVSGAEIGNGSVSLTVRKK